MNKFNEAVSLKHKPPPLLQPRGSVLYVYVCVIYRYRTWIPPPWLTGLCRAAVAAAGVEAGCACTRAGKLNRKHVVEIRGKCLQ